jgi:hypothetical protein
VIRDFTIEREHKKTDEKKELTSLKFSLGGIEIKTSLVGLLILTISVAFFYLYIRYVYQLVELPPQLPPPGK